MITLWTEVELTDEGWHYWCPLCRSMSMPMPDEQLVRTFARLHETSPVHDVDVLDSMLDGDLPPIERKIHLIPSPLAIMGLTVAALAWVIFMVIVL